MQLARIGTLCVLAAAASGCGGHEGASAAGAWAGTVTDATGTRTVTGACNQRDGEPTVVDCVFSVTDAGGGTQTGTLYGHLFTTPGSSDGSLSYAFGIVPPPCRINVSGDAAVTRTTIDGTYRGSNDCLRDVIREGRLSLARP